VRVEKAIPATSGPVLISGRAFADLNLCEKSDGKTATLQSFANTWSSARK